MQNNFLIPNIALAIVCLCLLGASTAEQEPPVSDCCFEHEAHQGVCRVTPAEGETCGTILQYLNTPGTVGKTYCANTRLREGWVAVDCPEEETVPSDSTAQN